MRFYDKQTVMKRGIITILLLIETLFVTNPLFAKTNKEMGKDTFNYIVDQFADIQVLRYRVDGFEKLSLNQKILIYYLSQAAEEGRDILFDQNGEYNLQIRKTLEAIFKNYSGDKTTKDYKEFVCYLKRVWFSNGIHHHYGMEKFEPKFSKTFFIKEIESISETELPLKENQTKTDLINSLSEVIFNPSIAKKRVNQAAGEDLILTSANNYYKNVTQQEVEHFYDSLKANGNQEQPLSYGLNSRLIKENGILKEEIYKLNGRYSKEIERILFWLEKAIPFAENEQQKNVIKKLISFYQTGDLATFDEYSILWVKDTESQTDFVNGFIETYGDPLGLKASWESIVNFKNIEATRRTETISQNAQWFENNSPIDNRFKKKEVKGVSAKVISAAMLGGDCYPATPIGINLPNANWIRQIHGSKSVTIENITDAYAKSALGNGFNEEFMYSEKEIELKEKYGHLADNLHTDLHECLGHGSGQLLPNVSQDALKAYGATIEEARADLFGLYYTADKKIVELGLLPHEDAYKAEYYQFMMNGLMTQLTRIKLGDDIEESHMRNRQLIAQWVYEKGKENNVVEIVERENKHFVKINNYSKLRLLFGELLKEIQRIKSEGDFEAAKNLVEKYGVKIDQELHREILDRYKQLNLAPYKGFVNPTYTLITNNMGEITDVKVSYTESYTEQMLRLSNK